VSKVAATWQVFGTLEKGRRELPKPSISGKWDEGLWAEMEDGSRVELWRPAPPPPDPTRSAVDEGVLGLTIVLGSMQMPVVSAFCVAWTRC